MAIAGPKRWFFDAWSRVYDLRWVQRSTYRPIHDAVFAALDGRRGGRILDLGCGTGQLAARLAKLRAGARIVGCDFSIGMLRRASARSPAAHFVQGDAGRLPFADRTFDAIVSTEAFHWFPDQAGALAECFRVLRPGGRLLLAVTNTPAAPVSELLHLASRLFGEPFYWPSGAQGRAWIERAGFRIEGQRRVARYGGVLLPPVLTDAVRPGGGAPQRRRGREKRHHTYARKAA
jgi:ubiquinone/menaquinone biosynthesis C-methylase UbiE